MSIGSYSDDGYVIVRSVFSMDEVKAISEQMREGIRDKLKELVPEQVAEEALKLDLTKDDKTFWAKFPAVQYAHKGFPIIEAIGKDDRIASQLREIMGENIKCIQSIYFMKSPGSEGVTWHQDEYYLPTRDRSLTAAWIALKDATIENGAVEVVPGSHKSGILNRMLPNEEGKNGAVLTEADQKNIVTVELKAGDVVFFSGHLLHASGYNRSQEAFREAVVFHYMSANSVFPYLPGETFGDKRLDKGDFRDFFMVSGEDPYEWKGKESLHKAFIQRPHNIYYSS